MSLSSEDIKKIIVNTELTSLEARKLCLEIGLEISIISKMNYSKVITHSVVLFLIDNSGL